MIIKNSDGSETFQQEAGDPANQAMVLIHGIGADHRMWEPQIQEYTDQGFFVLAPDMLAHGKSSKVKTLELGDWENQINELMRPKLLSEDASISFALFIVAIFGGLAWAGIMGLFYGPVLMLLLVTTIEIYAERYAHEDRNYLGEAFSKLGNGSKAAEPDAEAGAEGADRVAPESQDQAVDA